MHSFAEGVSNLTSNGKRFLVLSLCLFKLAEVIGTATEATKNMSFRFSIARTPGDQERFIKTVAGFINLTEECIQPSEPREVLHALGACQVPGQSLAYPDHLVVVSPHL